MKVSWLQDQLPRLAEHLESSAEELNGLDAQLGDGDLGVTMVRGSRQLLEIRESYPMIGEWRFLNVPKPLPKPAVPVTGPSWLQV